MEVTIKLPEDVAKTFVANGENLERKVLEATAIHGYRKGKLSHAQVGRILELDRFETDQFLKSHEVPLNYSNGDLSQDRITLEKLQLTSDA